MIKLAHMTAALADGLRRRRIGDSEANLAAEAGAAVYRVAFQQWVDTSGDLERATPCASRSPNCEA